MYLLILCIPAVFCFCGVHNVSSHFRFTCPMCTPRSGPPLHAYIPALITHGLRSRPNTYISIAPCIPFPSCIRRDRKRPRTPLPSPHATLPYKGTQLHLLRVIKRATELRRCRGQSTVQRIGPPTLKDARTAQGITARPGSGVSPLRRNRCQLLSGY